MSLVFQVEYHFAPRRGDSTLRAPGFENHPHMSLVDGSVAGAVKPGLTR